MQSDSMIVQEIIKTAVVPTTLGAGLAYGLGKWALKKGVDDLVPALAIFGGAAAGYLLTVGMPDLPPTRVEQWVPISGLAALVLVALFVKIHKFAMPAAMVVVMGMACWGIYKPLTRFMSVPEVLLWVSATVVFWAAMVFSERDAKETRQGPLFFALSMTATGISLVSTMDGGIVVGQTAGALAASCGGVYLACLLLPDLRGGNITAAVFSSFFVVLLLNAYHYVEVNTVACILAASAGFGVLTLRLPQLAQKGLVIRTTAVALVTLLPTIIAIVYLLTQGSPQDDYSY